jgi:hypothetical protein
MPDTTLDQRALSEIFATLRTNGVSLPKATAAWTRQLRDADEAVRLHAAGRLRMPGRAATTARDDVLAALPETSLPLRRSLLSVLAANEARGPDVRDAYRAALVADDANVRVAACEGLATLGEEGAPAIDRLAPLLEDADRRVAAAAAWALQQIGEPAERTLRALLEHRSSQVRDLARRALARELSG